MKLQFGDDDADTWMRCPQCDGNSLRHHRVDVYRRDKEDADTGMRVSTFLRGSTTINTSMQENPSPRGDGIRVHMTCSDCPSLVELVIVQDEGGTYIETDVVGSRGVGGEDE